MNDLISRLLAQILLITPLLCGSPFLCVLTDNDRSVVAKVMVKEFLCVKASLGYLSWLLFVKILLH